MLREFYVIPPVTALIVLSIIGSSIAITPTRRPSSEPAFWSGPFNACKGSRITTSVATVQAHVYAVKLINEVGIKTIAKLAVDLKVPPTAVYPIRMPAPLLCLRRLIEEREHGSAREIPTRRFHRSLSAHRGCFPKKRSLPGFSTPS